MVIKLGLVVLVSCLVVSIPAPIPSVLRSKKSTPEMSQSQLQQQQQSNGVVPVVGVVERSVDEVGKVKSVAGNTIKQEHNQTLLQATNRADLVGANNIVASEKAIVASRKKSGPNMFILAFVLAAGISIWKLFQNYTDKIIPVPKISKKLINRL
jgi:hypothetical protein